MAGVEKRKLIGIEVDGLLYGLHHKIDFPREWPFVILYGPNGVGKTRLLELVKASLGLDYPTLLATPFSWLRLSYDAGCHLQVTKEVTSGDELEQRCIISLVDSLGFETTWKTWKDPLAKQRQWIHEHTPYEPDENDLWRDYSDNEVVSFAELSERFALDERLLHLPNYKASGDAVPAPEALKTFCDSVPVHLIETQRLLALDSTNEHLSRGMSRRSSMYRGQGRPWRRTVTQYSADLTSQLSKALAENSRLSQQLDSTFPRRIIEATHPESVAEHDVRDKYATQNELRTRLAKFNLIRAEGDVPLPKRRLVDFELKALWMYLNDTDQKLASLKSLLERLELFVTLLNGRLVKKHLSIDLDNGLRITRQDTQEEVGAERLSSGEQHELVLVYDLLFRTPPGSTVLIDEPEISLHVAWQQKFLDDIQGIAALSDLRFVIATHSPQIIDRWWDRTSPLELD